MACLGSRNWAFCLPNLKFPVLILLKKFLLTGVYYEQELSGDVLIKEIFRYNLASLITRKIV